MTTPDSPVAGPQPQSIAPAQHLTKAAPCRKFAAKAQMFVRRAHLYLGLLLVPWVVLFGVSGFLFNHTGTTFGGPTREVAQFNFEEVHRIVGFEPVDAGVVAAGIVRQLDESAGGQGKYTLVDGNSAHFSANAGFSGRTTNGSVSLSLNLTDGTAVLSSQAGTTPAKQTKPGFADQQVQLSGINFTAMGEQAGQLVKAAGLTVDGAMTARARGGPELRFVVQDGEGRRWNMVCDLAQGRLSGRAADDESGLNFYSAVTRLHKTHHYPDRVGARWFLVLLADTLALTMVFWGVSGLIMWWQFKPTRVLGVLAMSVAAVVALVIFTGTLKDMSFGPTRARVENPAGM